MPKYDKLELYGDLHGNDSDGNKKVFAKGTVCTPADLVKAGMTEEGIKEAIKVGSMGEPIVKTADGKPKEDPIELVFPSGGSPSEMAEAAGEVKSKSSESPAPAAKQMDRGERVTRDR